MSSNANPKKAPLQASMAEQSPNDRAPAYQLPEHLPAMLAAPAEQLLPERFIIYSLVYGLRPERCLEIGAHWGGSATIICAAMDDAGQGRLITVDPNPLLAPEVLEKIKHRVTVLEGFSPQILSQAMERAGGPFDFALIDGDHTYSGLLRDIDGVLPVMADQAYLLFHDSHYFEINEAIDEALQRHLPHLFDCGVLSVSEAPENRSIEGRPVVWGGLRLVRFCRDAGSSSSNVAGPDSKIADLQIRLHSTEQRLAAIENTRTWRWASKIAYSPGGRFLSRMLSPFFGK